MSKRPLIIVTNDDGYAAPGVNLIADALEEIGEVWMVAPERERSAVSHTISLHKPLRTKQLGPRRFWCSGTPADCIYVGINNVLPRRPDLCVSGINRGANLGDDVTYSGTVGGAIEAALHDVPALAASMTGAWDSEDYDGAIAITLRVVRDMLAHGIPPHSVLNLNVPSGYDPEKGVQFCRVGRRHYGHVVEEKRDPRGRRYLWIGGTTPVHEPHVAGSDCEANDAGLASLTPLNLDLTHERLLADMGRWSCGTLAENA